MRWTLVLLLGAWACSNDDTKPMPQCPPDCPPSTDERHIGRQPGPNPIVAENQLRGDPEWKKGVAASEGELDAFATTDAAAAGMKVGIRVSANPPARLDVAVYRVGDYHGVGARLVARLDPVDAVTQPSCPLDTNTGMVECPWKDTVSFTVGSDWVSGIYVVKLSRSDRTFRHVPLVVRDGRAAEILFVSAFQTAQAYNRWGGTSLYWDGTKKLAKGRAYVVSADRPFQEGNGAGQVLRWEAHLARFLESQGYDVTYGTTVDFTRFDDVLVGIGMMVHGGHDEYWTMAERQQVDRALGQGRASLAYFGANGGYWRVRLEPAPDGRGERRIVCYKDDWQKDPIPNSTIRFRDGPDAHPEDQLFGNWYESYQIMGFPMVVGDDSHWAFEGTGLTRGTLLPGLLGYEYDTVGDGTPNGTAVLMDSPTLTTTGYPSTSQMVVRTQPNGRVVFSAGSIYTPLALSNDPETRDDRVARMVLNVVEHGLVHRRPMRTHEPVGTHVPAPPAPVAEWASSVSEYAGNAGHSGHTDGRATVAFLNGPTGLAVLPTGELAIAETRTSTIRLVSADGQTLSTMAGDGLPGSKNGPGTMARFRQPTGLAVLPDGSVLVADQLNAAIRRVARDGSGWTVSTYAGAVESAGFVDGAADQARFNRPAGLAVDSLGNVYVADEGNAAVRRIEASSRQVTTLAGGLYGDADASVGTQARFTEPSSVAVTSDAVYVYDGGVGRLRRISLDSSHSVTTIAGTVPIAVGFADGSGDAARFRGQLGLAALPTGELLLADTANYRLRLIRPGSSPSGTHVVTIAGSGLLGTRLGAGGASDLVAPTGVAVRPDGGIYVSDSGNHVVRIVTR